MCLSANVDFHDLLELSNVRNYLNNKFLLHEPSLSGVSCSCIPDHKVQF